jgi:hypothetical protein
MDLDIILLLAQEAAPATDGLPAWAKYILGPLGALVLMGVYAYWTEKKRIPQFVAVLDQKDKVIKELQTKNESFRDKCEEDKEKLRASFETKEKILERDVQDWRDRHTKEKAVRAWYQSQAQQLADDVGEKLKPPPDIDKTHYGGED